MSQDQSSPLPKITPEENVKPTWKPGCWTYFCVIVTLLAVLITLVGYCFVQSGQPLRISKETTYITEPLTPDGRFVDYFAELERRTYPPEMQTDENGFRVVFRALGDFANKTNVPALLRQRYTKLGLDVTIDTPTLTYTEPSKSIDDWELLAKSPDLHMNAEVQKWLEENNAALNLVAEQVKKPVFVLPYVGGSNSIPLIALPLTDAQAMRDLARGLEVRTKVRIGSGDVDGAIDDILACYRLGRHVEKQATLIEALVGIAIEGITNDLPYYLNDDKKANAEQLKRLQEGMTALSPQKGVLDKIETERFHALDIAIGAMKTPAMFDEFVRTYYNSDTTIKVLFMGGLDWNLILQKINAAHDESLAGTYVQPTLSKKTARLLTLKSRSGMAAEIFLDICSPRDEIIKSVYQRNECMMNMKRIVLAMHLYERWNGTLPPAFSVDADGKQNADGKPLHSWRTLLLPYLGDEKLAELYGQIRLDEPWDSEHNRQFHTRNLDIYRCPGAVNNDGEASYAVIVGDDVIGDELLFGNDGKGRSLANAKRYMIMLVERKEGVCWMRPDAEIPQHDAETGLVNKGVATVGSNHTSGANVAMRDGSVSLISETVNNAAFIEHIRGSEKRLP